MKPSWDSVSGYCFFVRNHAGNVFPFVQTFGITASDAKQRMRDAIARRIEHGRSRMDVVGVAKVTLTTDTMLQQFGPSDRWQEWTE
jgi:hypothetical protein